MDHPIQPPKGLRRAFTRKALPFWAAAIVVLFVLYLIVRPHSSTQRISSDTLSVSQVLRALRRLYPCQWYRHAHDLNSD